MTDLVLTEHHDGGVALLRLNRPPMNPLSIELLGELRDAAPVASAADAEVKAVVVGGSEKALRGRRRHQRVARSSGRAASADAFRAAFDAVAAIPRPVIAAIRGYARRRLRARAHMRSLASVPRTIVVGQPEILLGVIPGAGGTQRLARLVGPARAKELVWSGRQVRADEALALGILDRVVPADEVEENALHWAAHLGRCGCCDGTRQRVIDDGLGVPLAHGLDREADAFVEVFGTDDARRRGVVPRARTRQGAKFSGS